MVLPEENCPEKTMEAGEDKEPMVPKVVKKPEVTTLKAEELEVIVEDPSSSTIKTKVRIKVLTGPPLLPNALFLCGEWCDRQQHNGTFCHTNDRAIRELSSLVGLHFRLALWTGNSLY